MRRFFKGLVLTFLILWAWGRTSPWSDASPFPMFVSVIWAGRAFLKQPRSKKRWLVTPASIVLAAVVFLSPLPIQARFAIHRSSFEDFAASVEASPSIDEWRQQSLGKPGLIGPYEVISVHAVGDNVIIYSGSGPWFDDAGFAYLPDGPDPRLETGLFERPQFQSLGGGWYQWTASW